MFWDNWSHTFNTKIRNSEPLWFSDYVQNCTQAINIDGNISSFNNLTIKVPQNSVLGPLLFLISINGLPTCLTRTSNNIIICWRLPTCLTRTSFNIIICWRRIIAGDSTLKQVGATLQADADNNVKWLYKNRTELSSTICLSREILC